MEYKATRPTMAELVTTVQRWETFEGRAGLRGEVGEALDGDRVWITRVPNANRNSGYIVTLFSRAAWRAFRPAIRIREVPAHA
jgi:hypothetical protein